MAPSPDGIYWFWFKRFRSIYERLTQQLTICLQEVNIPYEKNYFDPDKRQYKQLRTSNVSANNVGNLNHPNKS